ncbi:MAG: flagellin [Pseudomonadota bacterium]
MSSILTNNGAMVALQTLKSINMDLSKTQEEISTGKSVGSAKDNAAVWAISKVMESDVKGFKAVSESLSLGTSTVAVARNASETVTDLLTDMKQLIVSAQEENVDRDAIQRDIDAYVEQIGAVVGAAQFNGQNLIDGSSAVDMEVLSSLDRSTDGSVSSSTIDIERQNLSVTDTVGTAVNGALVGVATDFTVLTGATVAEGADTTGTAGTTLNAAGVDITDETTNAPNAFADGTTVAFSIDAVEAGNTYAIHLSDLAINVVGGGETTGSRTFTYVASESDGATDVANNLASQISAFFGAATDAGDYTASVNSSTNAAGDVNLNEIQITNNSGAAIGWNASVQTGGTAGASATTGGLGALSTIDVTSDATGALAAIDGLIQQSIDASAAFGSAQNRIETQSTFVSQLTDSLTSGIGSLVDADMEAASARLQALQTQQQLGIQALSIANQAPQSILSLFR